MEYGIGVNLALRPINCGMGRLKFASKGFRWDVRGLSTRASWRVSTGIWGVSMKTCNYCQKRKALPEVTIEDITFYAAYCSQACAYDFEREFGHPNSDSHEAGHVDAP